jgi:hypothetical protein
MRFTFPTNKTVSLIIFLLYICILTLPAQAADIQVKTAVDRQEVFVGESFTMQIRVEGAESPAEPDISHLTDFTVRTLGGQSNSSTMVSNTNGDWQKITRHGYIFNYSITPEKSGELTIPSIHIVIDGISYPTRPITIFSREPEETSEFKLRMSLSQDTCYVGEPIILTTTWYVGKDVKNFEFNLPVLTDPRFDVFPAETEVAVNNPNAIEVPVGGDTVTATKGKRKLDGEEFLTVTFQHHLIPKQQGSFSLPQTTVACQALTGYRQSRSNRPFGGRGNDLFEDFFSSGRQAVYQTFVTPSNQPALTVLALPDKNKPASFSGLVGSYTIQAEAIPTQVNIGDPITLIITMEGSSLKHTALPDLSHFLPPESFKLPDERADGEIVEGKKVYTQTIRVKNNNVTEIPPLNLAYFDTGDKKYKTAQTAPIPLQVTATRIITALDAEGTDAIETKKKKIQEVIEGINHNYEGIESEAANQNQKSPAFLWLALLLPPGLFFMGYTLSFLHHKRNSNGAKRKNRKAYAALKKDLASSPQSGEHIHKVLQNYLAAKIDQTAGTITFADVKAKITQNQKKTTLLNELKQIMEECETLRYAGGEAKPADTGRLQDTLIALTSKLEEKIW